MFVVSGGAVNSAALLLRSVADPHPNGLGNSSGPLGRNYMVHNSTFFMGVNPWRRNRTAWQKTLGLNDWYVAGPDTAFPLGNVQMLGKLGPMVKAARPWAPIVALNMVTDRSVDLYLTTEDLPARTTGSCRWRPDHHRLDAQQHRAAPELVQAGLAGRSARRATRSCSPSAWGSRPTRTVRHRGGRHGPADERPRPRLSQPRRGQPVGRRQLLLPVLGRAEPRPDDRRERASGRPHHRRSHSTSLKPPLWALSHHAPLSLFRSINEERY